MNISKNLKVSDEGLNDILQSEYTENIELINFSYTEISDELFKTADFKKLPNLK